MNLQDFISETLTQIANGVSDAQEKLKENGAVVSPKIDKTAGHKAHSGMLPAVSNHPATLVAFDVALTATEGTDTKGGIGIVAGIVSLGSAGHSSNENSSVSRVQFNVPIVLPHNS